MDRKTIRYMLLVGILQVSLNFLTVSGKVPSSSRIQQIKNFSIQLNTSNVSRSGQNFRREEFARNVNLRPNSSRKQYLAKVNSGSNLSNIDIPRSKRSPRFRQFTREPLYAAPPVDRAYLYEDYPEEDVPEEAVTFPRFQSPLARQRRPPARRRSPPNFRYGVPPPSRMNPTRSRPIQLPLTPHHPRRLPSLQTSSYGYPRDAGNIQDILSYFKKEEQEATRTVPSPRPSLSHTDLAPVSMGGDFSKELHDVQTSLLKDIREFAQRPGMISQNHETTKATTTTLSPTPSTTSYRAPNDDHPDDSEDENEPKAKPVREMIKNRPISIPKRSKNRGWIRDSSEEKPVYNKAPVRSRYKYEDADNERLEEDEESRLANHASREKYYKPKGSQLSSYTRSDSGNSGSGRLHPKEDSEEVEKERESRHRPSKIHEKRRYVGGSHRSAERDRSSREEETHHRNRDHRDRDRRDRERYRHHKYSDDPREMRYQGTPSSPIVIKEPNDRYNVLPGGRFHHDKDQQLRHSEGQMSHPSKGPWFRHNEGQMSYPNDAEGQRSQQNWNIAPDPVYLPTAHALSAQHHTYSPTFYRGGYNRPPVNEVEDIVEIHTGGSTPYKPTPPPPPPPQAYDHPEGGDRKNRLHKLYLEYLERKLEAETLAAVSSSNVPVAPFAPVQSYPPLPPVPSPKLSPPQPPMRMKIHIYPNENTAEVPALAADASERRYGFQQTTTALPRLSFSHQTPAVPHFAHSGHQNRRGPNSFGNFHQRTDSSITFPQTPPTGESFVTQTQRSTNNHGKEANNNGKSNTPSVSTAVDKNKNLVLHLHVHRRQDERDMVMAGSEIHPTTVKPLTYQDIYDQVQDQQHQAQYHALEEQNKRYAEGTPELPNKSVSLEVPLREERIEDVLQSLLKFGH